MAHFWLIKFAPKEGKGALIDEGGTFKVHREETNTKPCIILYQPPQHISEPEVIRCLHSKINNFTELISSQTSYMFCIIIIQTFFISCNSDHVINLLYYCEC